MKIISSEFIDIPTISCHAGATTYFKGERLTAWFGGDVEGGSDTDIWLQKGDASAHPLNVNFNRLPAWNPVFVHASKRLFLFFKVGKFCDCWQTFYMEYKNGKMDREGLKRLPAGMNGPVKTPPVTVKGGTILFGSSVETWYTWTSYIEVCTFKNGVFHFQEKSDPISLDEEGGSMGGVIQPSLIIDDKSVVHGFFRSKRSGIMYGTDKNNFTPLKKLYDGPNSSVAAVYHKGFAYLAHNTVPLTRVPLILMKMDISKTFPESCDSLEIETDIDSSRYEMIAKEVQYPSGFSLREIGVTQEASYPYMIVNPEGDLELVYTYGRRGLKRTVIKV